MFELKNVTRRFGNKLAVDSVTLDIAQGQMVGIIGRSGAGKSTLLRMINRLQEPSSGSIHFGGVEVSGLRGEALRNWQRDCAMIFQVVNSQQEDFFGYAWLDASVDISRDATRPNVDTLIRNFP